MAANPSRIPSRDIRVLNLEEVSSLGQWLDKYMRLELEDPLLTNSDLLFQVLIRSSREFEGDLGVFGVED